MRYIYQIFIFLYPIGIRLVALLNEKARKWISGRKNIFLHLQQTFRDNKSPVLWMHCASLGEFEQGRPLLEKFKMRHPDFKVFLTFFSPSGYEVRKNYKGADYIFYLPMDSAANARRLLQIVQPKLVIFVKYEFWYHYLMQIKASEIPLYLISGIFRPSQVFFKPIGGFYRKMLYSFQYLFVQDETSLTLLHKIGMRNVSLAGDTRFDRVIEIANAWKPIPEMENFVRDAFVLVAGSTWPEDETCLSTYASGQMNIKYIIAPHEITERHLQKIMTDFPRPILFSQWKSINAPAEKYNTLIIDNIGMLSRIYKYASVAYVGGAWGKNGIHNVLEAAVYGKPVLCGPNHHKSIEVQNLINAGGGFAAKNFHALHMDLNALYTNTTMKDEMGKRAGHFVLSNAGATKKILSYVEQTLQS